jgi:hypothetical protein
VAPVEDLPSRDRVGRRTVAREHRERLVEDERDVPNPTVDDGPSGPADLEGDDR